MKRYRLVALDLDGTLVDSAPDLTHCLGEGLATAGLSPPRVAEARQWIGDGIEMLVRRGLTAGLGEAPSGPLLEAALAAFHRCYRDNLFVASRLYPGVRQTLLHLRRRGIVLGCITNKPQAYTGPLLEQAGIAGLLDFAFSGDTFDTKKPDAKPLLRAADEHGIAAADAVMIGDSRNDRDAARSAGFGFVFAAYGYASPDDPELNQADAVLGAFSGLSELLSG